MSALRILLVEDEESMADVISQRIGAVREKFPDADLQRVGSRAEGLRIVRETPRPDCVFLDLGLPDSVWTETLNTVDEFETESPVIIVTGHPEQMVMDLLANKEIQVIHKDDAMWGKLLGAILRAIQRGKSDTLAENIRRMKELLSQYAPTF